MRKIILALMLVFSLNSIAYSAVWDAQFISDMPNRFKIKMDYNGRTDGQPVYVGYAPVGTATSSTDWMIFYLVYDGDNQVTDRTVAFGSWDNRAGLSYQ